MPRRPMDFYETSREAVDALVEHYLGVRLLTTEQILEACAGNGAIASALQEHGYRNIWCNDLDHARPGHTHLDARAHDFAYPVPGFVPIEAVVTNPPFNQAFDILKNLYSQVGAIALLLRLTFLEPTKRRGQWLANNPPKKMIVLPRYSFTGDGRTDSVTCAWMIWDRNLSGGDAVVIAPKKERQ